MLNVLLQQLMNNEIQFKIVRGKGHYGGNNSVKQIADILGLSKDASQCVELRILHCPQLAILNGIQVCKLIKNLNLSCNAIEDLAPVRFLNNLEALDVKANRIRSLKGIDNLRRLVRLDASQNRIESLEGLGEANCQIQHLILFKNNIKSVGELTRLKTFREIKEISFEKAVNQRSNPFCQNKSQYYAALQINLQASKETIQKIDELSPQQVSQFFKKSFQHEPSYEEESGDVSIIHNRSGQRHDNFNYNEGFQPKRSQNMQTPTVNALTNQKLMLMTQRQADLQRIIDMKGQTIQQLKMKYAQLQMANTNQYRDSIKKEVQLERVSGQISELSKAIDQKDHKINDLHKRIEELLKVNTAANSLADTRSQELQKLRRQFGQLRIENSELRVLNKDQQNRLRELQNKALTNIQDKSQRIEQLRSKSEHLMKENYDLQHQQDEYKERIRQLTQLLKQWEVKYEQTVRELESYHNREKQDIFNEIQSKSNEANRRFQEAQHALNQQWQEKLTALEHEYQVALSGAVQKFNRLKRAYDEKNSSQAELKALLKSVMAKNTENQNTIKQYEDAIIKTKKAIISLTNEHQTLSKEHYQLKNRLEGENRHLQNQLSKALFAKDKLERQARELRANNEYLQKNFDNLNSREKEFQELLEKVQNLQTALDAKNVMLDDKNETIESLKLDIEALQKEQQGKIDIKQHQKLNQKYRRQKDLLKSLEQQNNALLEENKDLNERCQVNNTLQQQFVQVKEIMRKQEAEIREKEDSNNYLLQTLEKLKNYSQNISDELTMVKNEKNKLLNSLEEKQNKWNRLLREKQSENERKLQNAQEQINKYRRISEQFRNLTRALDS